MSSRQLFTKSKRRVLFALIFLAVAAFFAPSLFAAFGLNNVLAGILPEAAGRVSAQSASLGWFSPTRLSGVSVHDAQGELLVKADSVALNRSVWDLITAGDDLGTVSVAQANFSVAATESSSNIEQFIADLVEHRQEPSDPISCKVQIDKGRIIVNGPGDAPPHTVAINKFECQLAAGTVRMLNTALATPTISNAKPGALTIAMTTRADHAQQVDVKASRFPLHPLAPWLGRLLKQGNVSGIAHGEAIAVWRVADDDQTSHGFAAESTGDITLTDLEVSSPGLGTDRIQLASVHIPWQLRVSDDALQVEKLNLTSNLGELAGSGTLPLNKDGHASDEDAWQHALQTPLNLQGNIDLARLAAMLPATLRIRNDIAITSGTAKFALASHAENAQHRWTGDVAIEQVRAVRNGQQFGLDRPVAVSVAVRRTDRYLIDSLRCDSEFLTVVASGDAKQMTAEVEFDLARLTTELSQFVELGDWRPTGKGLAKLTWQPTQGGPSRAKIDANVRNLRFTDTAGRLWQEPTVALQADVLFTQPQQGPWTLQPHSTLTISAGTDSATVRMEQPIPLSGEALDSLTMQGTLQMNGDLARWQQRLAVWAPLEGWRLAGNGTLATKFHRNTDTVNTEATQLVLTELQVVGPGWRIVEPRVQLDTSVAYNVAGKSVRLGDTTLVGHAASLRARDIAIALGDAAATTIEGEAAFRVALGRVDAWRMGSDGKPPQLRPSGALTGNVAFNQQADQVAANVSANITDFVLFEYAAAAGSQAGYRRAWEETKLEVVADASFEPANELLTLRSALIRSQSLGATVAGTVTNWNGAANVRLRGTVEYDLADVGPLVSAYVGRELELTGKDQATFELVGQFPSGANVTVMQTSTGARESDHWSKQLRGNVSAGWQSMHVFGLPLGRGRVAAQLEDGLLNLTPLHVSVGEQGKLTAAASARLSPPPRVVELPPGQILTNVQITPEVSSRLLKYIHPLLAGVTAAEGTFSLGTDGGRIPLDDPKLATAQGRLSLDNARIRPGPLAQQVLSIAGQFEGLLEGRPVLSFIQKADRDWLVIDQQQVEFHVADGRVHHQNMQLKIGDVIVRSRGWVGFDETLAIDVEVPIQDSWREKRPLLTTALGESILIPIRGTLTSPRWDERALLQKLIGAGAQGAIQSELGNVLDQLFK